MDSFVRLTNHKYEEYYLYGFIAGLNNFKNAIEQFHKIGKIGFADGCKVRQIGICEKRGKALTEELNNWKRPEVSFDDISGWICPGEYSYCSRCGWDYTLRRGNFKQRPPCPFCSKLVDYKYENYSFWLAVKHYLSYVFNKSYRAKINEYKQIEKDREEQKRHAAAAEMERTVIASHRKHTLNLPPLFWLKENGKKVKVN